MQQGIFKTLLKVAVFSLSWAIKRKNCLHIVTFLNQ